LLAPHAFSQNPLDLLFWDSFFDAELAGSPGSVEIDVWGFRKEARVFFGALEGNNATVISSNKIRVQPPAQSPGPVDVTVAFSD